MVKIVPAVTAIATLANFTEFAFATDPMSFLIGKKYGSVGTGFGNYLPGNKVSLLELFNIGQLASNPLSGVEQMRNNLNRQGALTNFIMMQVGITVVNTLVKRTPVVRSFNKLSRAIGTEKLIMG